MKNSARLAIVLALIAAIAAVVALRNRSRPAPIEDPTAPLAAADSPAPPAALPRLIEIGSDVCIPCKMMAPILDELRKTHAGRLQVDVVDIHKDRAAAEAYGVRVIPTQIFLDADGQEVFRHEGFFPKEQILKRLDEIGVR